MPNLSLDGAVPLEAGAVTVVTTDPGIAAMLPLAGVAAVVTTVVVVPFAPTVMVVPEIAFVAATAVVVVVVVFRAIPNLLIN